MRVYIIVGVLRVLLDFVMLALHGGLVGTNSTNNSLLVLTLS